MGAGGGAVSDFIGLSFGALAEPLSTQLGRQGVKAPRGMVRMWQRDADAITRLVLRRYLSSTQADKSRRKLMGLVEKGVTR
ncbi:hypothetical protein UFOVP509_22 [uncultured Caudovirales phage]|uniref:Uncharacterized protein n=1 Tax=uncultured Caudovirales phage TaxID=2100421 RepID=A0A6J5ML55_9CAUD|nr:hypothetical protein UFOVP509_22 [uncultured Caudovirales phage]